MPKEKFAEPFKMFAEGWQKYYAPPGQPSKQAIEAYQRFIKGAIAELSRKPRILILGATPELRDLAYALGAEVTIIDINLEMILAMTELCKHKNPDEIIVRASWLNAPLKDDYWDIALGDIVLSNLPMEKQGALLCEIRRLLKPHGYFISKFEVISDNWKPEDFDQILNRYSKISFKSTACKNIAMELFADFHNTIAWSPKTEIVDVTRIRKWLKKYQDGGGKITHPNKNATRYLTDIWEFWKPMEKAWACKTEKGLEKQLRPYFKILEKKILSDCYFPRVDKMFPIWMCRAK